MTGNLVVDSLVINGKLDLIPLAADYDDTFTGVASQDMDRLSKDVYLLLQVGDSDTTVGLLSLEESSGDGVWTRIWSQDIVGGDLLRFVKLTRSKRYVRVPNPGLDAMTTTTMALTLFY